jgi:lipopolysaccharide transport system permease protein
LVGILLETNINSEKLTEKIIKNDFYDNLQNSRVEFIINRKLRKIAGRKKLGILWMALDPLATSLVYLFVLTVFRSSPNAETMLIGIGMYKIFQSSIKSGVNSISDFSGGLKLERVSSNVLLKSIIKFRIIDTFLQSFGVILVLFIGFQSNLVGIFVFLLLAQIIGIMAEGFGLNLALTVRKIPDIGNIINYFLLLMFFGSPVLYPMELTEGLHYTINEYNPFSFFVEYSRWNMDLSSEIFNIEPTNIIFIMLILGFLAIRGLMSLDNLRWKVSNWS